ncbi:MAG: hypothetical protein ACE5GY_06930 [Thermodesulfobacteriota bacterium]
MIINPRRALPLLLLCMTVLASCAHVPRGPKEQGYLYPAPDAGKGNRSVGSEAIFENDSVRMAIRQMRKDEPAGVFIAGLLDRDYVIFRLSIENRGAEKIIYNPSYTVLTNGSLDYRKPLDFTDLYDIAGGTEKLRALRGRFYDVNVTVAPGTRTSRMLIFRPFSEGAQDAELAIKEIYIGTGTERMAFRFVMKAVE